MAEDAALYLQRIELICSDLQIPPNYGALRALRLFPESVELVTVDESDPTKRLAPEAAEHWLEMKRAAVGDGIKFILISGFRSLERQRELIENKLKRGDQLAEVLQVLAAPGYSQHHTGLALDIGATTGFDLTEAFEQTDAFKWLVAHAKEFGFIMPYPRSNRYGFIYEPWHWVLETIEDLRV
jgi:D-alanyl-D-alanine carboxypeptidase